MDRPDESILSALADLPVPTLTATLYGLGITNCFLVGLTPLDPENARFVGTARTMRALPVREDIRDGLGRGDLPNLHREGLAALEPGDVVVTDCGGDARLSFFGELISTHLKTRGVAAIVTDAGIADVADVAATGLPVFAQGSAPIPGPARKIVSDLDRPVSCMGTTVYPGDVLVGDANGVAVIPRAMAAEVAAKATEKERLERFLLQRLKDGAPLQGTYPPDEATMAAYREHLAVEK